MSWDRESVLSHFDQVALRLMNDFDASNKDQRKDDLATILPIGVFAPPNVVDQSTY